jgi:hypothetical protein
VVPPPPPKKALAERQASLEAALARYECNLADLLLQKAEYGLNVPTPLRNEIRNTEAEIARIKAELQELRERIEAEARKQNLYDQGMAHFRGKEWTQARLVFEQILNIDKFYKDVPRRLAQAKKQEDLEQGFTKAREAKVVQCLQWKAHLNSTRQWFRDALARYRFLGTAILAVLLLLVLAIPVLDKLMGSAKPTPTLSIPPISVKSFFVTTDGRLATIKPGEIITATIGEIVHIKAETSMTNKESEKDLVFTWYTCRKAPGPMDQRIGNPETLYVALGEPGSDCISVVIEKGGAPLDKREIFVDIQK